MNNQPILLLQEKIKEFIISQNVLSMVASVTIAVAAGTVIKSFVIDILFPIFDFVFKNKNGFYYSAVTLHITTPCYQSNGPIHVYRVFYFRLYIHL